MNHGKKGVLDGQCKINIPDFSVKDEIEKKVDKKDSSKRLR